MEIEEFNDVSLPEFHQLCLQDVSFTSIVAHGSPWRMMEFKMLNHLTVCSCNQLKYLLPLFVLKDLQQLKTIDISDCEQLENLFVDEQDTQTTKSNVMEVLPLLHSLTLINLPELSLICSGDAHLNSRSLTQMTVENCPKFSFTFVNNLRSIKEEEPSKKKSKEMILTPSRLKKLIIRRVDHLKNMCEDPKVSFEHLTYLQLENCNKLEYLFSLSTAQSLSCLQELRIISCERIKQIVKRETEETRANTIEFLQLKTLILEQLPKFTGSSGQYGASVRWCALETVKVVQCSNIQKSMLGTVDRPLLKNVTVLNCLPWESGDVESNISYFFELTDELSKLENLKIEDSKQLKKYMEMELQGSSFRQLKTIEALHCDNELNKFLSILLRRSYNLELLTVERCEGLEQVFDLTDFVAEEPRNPKFPNLNTMQLLYLRNLHCIWNKDPRGIMAFGRLVKLEIIECGLSKSPLSTALVEELVLLEALKIESCEMIEQVIEDGTEMQESSFRNLKDLQLASLPNLIKLNSGLCNVKFPELLNLRIENCPILNAFTAQFLSNQLLTIEGTSNHVPADENVAALPRLKHLKLVSASTIKRLFWWTQFDRVLIPLQNLETMEIVECNDLHYLFVIEGLPDTNDAELFGGLLPELRQLCLRNLDSLTSIVGLNSHRRILNFKMLNHVTVCSCNQLKYLLPLYVLKDLQQLKTIGISDCEQLEHVFADEQDTPTTKSNVMQVLPLLHSLTLINLPELARICSGDAHFTSRSLTQMTVENCPKFIFTFVNNLRSIKEEERSKKKSKGMILTPSRLKNLIIRGVDHLKNMCEDPKVSFEHLTYLQLENCKNLIIRRADHLKNMCEDPKVSFEHLTYLQLENCNKLEYLFSLSTAQSLSCLQELRIISCERIKQIVKRETEETRANTIEFLQLKTLILEQLPKFTGSSGQYGASVRWCALETVKVVQCSNIQKSMLGTVDRPLLKNVTVLNCLPWESGDVESNISYFFELTDELSKLENLKIEDSKQLKKYMEMELQGSSFRQLKTIEALHCDNELNKFLSILLRLSDNLELLTVERCEGLEQVFDLTDFVAEEPRNPKFPNLNTMQLLYLRNLHCIWNKDPRGIMAFGRLVKLEIIECGLSKSPLSTALVEELVLLEALKIESCEMIEQVIEDGTEMQESSFRNLKDLQLASLPNLIKLNSGHCNVKFPNLLSLRIENCPKFLSFFWQHACPELQTLKLAGLEVLEDIWKGQDYPIPLYHLKCVELDSFSQLRYMWIAKSENLETLVVRNCNSLGSLVLPSNCFNMKEIKISDCKILEEIFIDPEQQKMDEKTIPLLEYIFLENLPKLSFFSLETREFPSLRKLRIVNCPTLVSFPKNVSEHSKLVLFEDIKEDSQPGVGKMKIPPQLQSLELMDLPNLQLWTQEPKIPVFQKLTSLEIINCGSFKKLFSISGAENLSSLKLLALYGCVDMVHVLQGVRGTGLQVVVFKQLEKLVLKHLPKLTSFCEEDVDFGELPELKMVTVEDIPNMNTFVKLPLSTPKLKQVHVTYITKCWLGNLNQTIIYLHQDHDKLKNKVWESDQSSTSHHWDTAESSSHQEINKEKGKTPME